ncbi:hypothetical protein GOODEAATRI_027117 [Goodea atripinnis]|uniref:Secreted protein n=1 Tax=Goodea atripinnis TaxID=208336 RepID=A0ABV0PHD8_9TELE
MLFRSFMGCTVVQLVALLPCSNNVLTLNQCLRSFCMGFACLLCMSVFSPGTPTSSHPSIVYTILPSAAYLTDCEGSGGLVVGEQGICILERAQVSWFESHSLPLWVPEHDP